MSIARNIAATYRGPGRVVTNLLAMGQREDRALAYLMAACVLMFVAQLPRLAREAHMTGADLNILLGGSLMALLFVAPLMFYAIASLSHLVARVLGGQGNFYAARIAMFWALLAASPLMLLWGLVAGFVGQGVQQSLVGIIWCAVFFWFWGVGLWQAEHRRST